MGVEPLRVPLGFWAREEVGQALTGRNFGELFRLLGKYAGASQTQIAIAVGMTQGQVSMIMAGSRRVTSIDVAERAFDGLDAPDRTRAAFGLAPRHLISSDEEDPAGLHPADTGISEQGVASERQVDRRDVVKIGGTALTVGPGHTRDLTAYMLTAPGPGPDAPPDVATLSGQAETAWQLRQRADYEALGRLLPVLLGGAEACMPTGDDAAREHTGRILVHAYNAASSLLKKLRDEPFALLAADRAVGLARLVGDPILTAAAMYRLANVLLAAQRLDEARSIALSAADLTEPGRVQTPRSLAVWGGLLLTSAVAAARRGAESDAWELMGEARAASRILDGDYADIYSIFGPTNLSIHCVQVAVELQKGADAVRRSKVVDADRLPPSLVERRGQFLIDVAHGHVLERNDGEAVATLLCAEAIAPQEVRLSREAQDMARTMLRRERIDATSGLRDFAARVGAVD
jgi:transcriptional regulator with XRE-family HTH domain